MTLRYDVLTLEENLIPLIFEGLMPIIMINKMHNVDPFKY